MKLSIFGLLLISTLSIFGLTACSSTENTANQPAVSTATPPHPKSLSSEKSLPKIVAFGDSLTAGYGLSTKDSYPSLLQEKLKKDGFEYEVVNAGVSGDTTAGGVRRIDWALEGDVRAVILELGANDLMRGQPIKEMKKNLAEIIEKAQAKKAAVILAAIEVPKDVSKELNSAVTSVYQELSKEYNVTLIPSFLDRVAGIESLNQNDGIHPNIEGTKIVTENVYKYVKPILEKEEKK
ncbi:MAG: arylesterase [Blastocatellia bacterium]|nr:arylesterase [Blastocatellia bacterium]